MLRYLFQARHRYSSIVLYLIGSLIMVWPISALAGATLDTIFVETTLQAPFLFSWSTIWFFAIGGGVMSNFVKLDVDNELRAVYIAKPFIGILFSMSAVMYFNEDNNPPGTSLAIAALGAAFVGAPLMQGLLIYITKTDFLPKLFASIQKRILGGK